MRVLVGTALMQAEDVAEKIKELKIDKELRFVAYQRLALWKQHARLVQITLDLSLLRVVGGVSLGRKLDPSCLGAACCPKDGSFRLELGRATGNYFSGKSAAS